MRCPWAPIPGASGLTLPGSRGGRSVKRLLATGESLRSCGSAVPVLCVGDRPAAVWGVGTDMEFLPEESGQNMEITVTTNGGNRNG